MNSTIIDEKYYYFLPIEILEEEIESIYYLPSNLFEEEKPIIKSKLSPKAKEFIPFNTNNYK